MLSTCPQPPSCIRACDLTVCRQHCSTRYTKETGSSFFFLLHSTNEAATRSNVATRCRDDGRKNVVVLKPRVTIVKQGTVDRTIHACAHNGSHRHNTFGQIKIVHSFIHCSRQDRSARTGRTTRKEIHPRMKKIQIVCSRHLVRPARCFRYLVSCHFVPSKLR